MLDRKNDRDLVILLTATVHPNTTINVANPDPSIRLREYQTSIAKWADVCSTLRARLVIVETSGATFEALTCLVAPPLREDIHLLCFRPRQTDVTRGKGFIEWQALRFALSSNACIDAGTVYKVTGRLEVANPSMVFTAIRSDAVSVRMKIDASFADTRVVGASVESWNKWLLPADRDVALERGIDIEQSVAANLARARSLGLVKIQRFHQRPFFRGVSGFNSERYVPWRFALRGWLLRPAEVVVAWAARRFAR